MDFSENIKQQLKAADDCRTFTSKHARKFPGIYIYAVGLAVKIINLLLEDQPLTIGEVREKLEISHEMASTIIHELCEMKYLKISPNNSDGYWVNKVTINEKNFLAMQSNRIYLGH